MMDKNSLYAAYSFMETCQKAGIQPIIGCELDWQLEGQEREVTTQLIALTTKGYRNLLKISTAKMTGQDNFEDIRQYLVDIATIIPYFSGIEELDIGLDYYVGVTRDTPVQDFHGPILPIHTVRFFEEQQLESLQVLHAIRDNVPLNQVADLDKRQILLSADSLTTLFSSRFPQAVDNLRDLVAGISYQLNTDLKLPRFNRERPAVEELYERSYQGLEEKAWLIHYIKNVWKRNYPLFIKWDLMIIS